MGSSRVTRLCYAPNFKESGEAYCFWVVRPSVRPSVRPFVTLFDALHNFRTVNATVLKFLIWIPHGKIPDMYFFFLTGSCPFSELWPFEKIWMQSCQQNISKTIEARALKLDK